MDLNNRRTGKDATKPRALWLLGHMVIDIAFTSTCQGRRKHFQIEGAPKVQTTNRK